MLVVLVLVLGLRISNAQSCSVFSGTNCDHFSYYDCNCHTKSIIYDCSYDDCMSVIYDCNPHDGDCISSHTDEWCCKDERVCDLFFIVCLSWHDECVDSCSKEVCDSYETVYDTCAKEECSFIPQLCTRDEKVCDSCVKCDSLVNDYNIITCPDDGYYCNGDNLELRDYSCDDDCSYSVTSIIHCANGCSDGSCVSSYPLIVSRHPYSFIAYDSVEESYLRDFLGLPEGVDIDSYLNSLSNSGVSDWRDYWVNVWVSLNEVNSNELISFTNQKYDEYYSVKASVSVSDESNSCPSGWSSFNNHCYKVVKGNWLSVKNQCNSLGAKFVTINSLNENKWVNELAGGGAWIGFSDMRVEGEWVWDGDDSLFTHWDDGEPNNAHGYEDCAQFWADGYWNDANCNQVHNGVCELIPNSVGDGVCGPGEDYCNSIDCPKPVCGSCEDFVCNNGIGSCVSINDCCGNGLCELGEDYINCSIDCGELIINSSTINCVVNNDSCINKSIISGDVITISYEFNQKPVVSVKAELMSDEVLVGLVNTSDKRVTHSFTLPPGKHLLVEQYNDKQLTLMSLVVSGVNSTSSKPFDFSAGSLLSSAVFINKSLGGTLMSVFLSLISGASLLLIKNLNLLFDKNKIIKSVFDGLAGLDNDDISHKINVVKSLISIGQLLIPLSYLFGGFYTPIGAALMLIGLACSFIDNINDVIELLTSFVGAIRAYVNGDKDLGNELLINSSLALIGLLPLGDFVQDGRRVLRMKLFSRLFDEFNGDKLVKQLSESIINSKLSKKGVRKLLRRLKLLDINDLSLVKRIVSDLSDESIDKGLGFIKRNDLSARKLIVLWDEVKGLGVRHNYLIKRLIKEVNDDNYLIIKDIFRLLGNADYFFSFNKLLRLTDDKLIVIKRILSNASGVGGIVKRTAKLLGINVVPPSRIRLVDELINAKAKYNSKNNIIKVSINAVKRMSDDEVNELITHEFLHSITNYFSDDINKIMSKLSRKYVFKDKNDFINIGENEAHDILIHAISKKNDELSGFSKLFEKQVAKKSDELISVLRSGDEGAIKDLLSDDVSAAFIAERSVIEPKSGVKELLNNLLSSDDELLVKRAREVIDLSNSYEAVINLV